MEVGKLYRLNSREKEKLKEQERYFAKVGINATVDNHNKVFPADTLIVPLEIYITGLSGAPLKEKTSRRLKVLLSTGDIGTMYLSTDEWEEATE